jgi:hypothetical protein
MNSQDRHMAVRNGWRSIRGAETVEKWISHCAESDNRIYLPLLITALLAVLAAGLWGRFSAVAPVEKDLIALRLKLVATQIDSLVSRRAAIVSTAAGESQLDKVIENQALDGLVKELQELAPDFRSLEVTNDHGEVLAMVGDLVLSQAGSATVRGANFVPVIPSIPRGSGFLIDDAANGCFYVVCRHVGADKIQWFSRTKFSRESLDKILSGTAGYSAALVPMSGGKALEDPFSNSADSGIINIATSSLQGPYKAECLLKSSGLLIRLEKKSTTASFFGGRLTWAILILAGIAGIVALCLRAFKPMRDEWEGDRPMASRSTSKDASAPHEVDRAGRRFIAEEPSKRAASVRLREPEIALPTEPVHEENTSGARHGDQTVSHAAPPRHRPSDDKAPSVANSVERVPTVEPVGAKQPRTIVAHNLCAADEAMEASKQSQSVAPSPETPAANASQTLAESELPETLEVTWEEPIEEAAPVEEKPGGQDAVRLSEFFTF